MTPVKHVGLRNGKLATGRLPAASGDQQTVTVFRVPNTLCCRHFGIGTPRRCAAYAAVTATGELQTDESRPPTNPLVQPIADAEVEPIDISKAAARAARIIRFII